MLAIELIKDFSFKSWLVIAIMPVAGELGTFSHRLFSTQRFAVASLVGLHDSIPNASLPLKFEVISEKGYQLVEQVGA
jgi:hypothetical protein